MAVGACCLPVVYVVFLSAAFYIELVVCLCCFDGAAVELELAGELVSLEYGESPCLVGCCCCAPFTLPVHGCVVVTVGLADDAC